MNRLPACRVCLAYDTRLCSMMDGQLRDIYETLVKASLDTEDMLPTSACYICISFMKKILQFRDRSLKANQILQQMIICGLEPSVSSLDMLVKGQTGVSWTLGISDTERTTTTTGNVDVKVKIESVKSEIDVDRLSDRNEDYSDGMPVYRDSTSDFEDDLPLQNISEQCKTDRVKIEETPKVQLNKSSGHADYSDGMPVYRDCTSDFEDDLPLQNISEQCKTDRVKIEETPKVQLNMSSGHAVAAPPENRRLDKNEAENEFVIIQASLRKTEKNEEPRKHKEDKKKIPYFRKGSKKYKSPIQTILNESKTTTSNIISEQQNSSSFNKNDTVTPSKDIFTCDLCKNEYQCKILLESHMKKSHVIELNRKDLISSGLNVTNEYKSNHLLKVQEIQNNDNQAVTTNFGRNIKNSCNEKRYQCSYCMKRFSRNNNLSYHLRFHTKQNLCKCDVCEKSFTKSCHLAEHLRVHTNGKPFKCNSCEKSFSSKSHLTIHLRTHTKEKPFKCDICEKCFSQSSHLTTHLRIHSGEKPHSCSYCDKRFSDRSSLIFHLSVHTNEKPFKCDECGRGFAQRNDLTRHNRIHSGEKPYSCSYCDKTFADPSTLSQHLRVHTNVKPYKCDSCDKGFSVSGNLVKHLRVHHIKEKPCKCDICGKGFSQSSYLVTHLRTHLGEKP